MRNPGKDAEMKIDLQNDEIKKWQANNNKLVKNGYQLVTYFWDDREPEMWAIKGDEKILNNPPIPGQAGPLY